MSLGFTGGFGDYFKNDNGNKSMTRLLCFLSFFPSSAVVIWEHNAETLGWFVSAYVLGYVGGKIGDIFNKPTTGVTDVRTESTSRVTVAEK